MKLQNSILKKRWSDKHDYAEGPWVDEEEPRCKCNGLPFPGFRTRDKLYGSCKIQELAIPARGVTSNKLENRNLQEFATPAHGTTSIKEIKKRCGDTATMLYCHVVLTHSLMHSVLKTSYFVEIKQLTQ